MTANFTLRQLSYFVAAARTGTTQAAAEEMYISQSAMSSALADLERALDAQVFVRRRAKGLELTDTGRTLLPLARRLLADADDLQDVATDLQHELRGELVVGCFEVIAPSMMPGLIRGFQSRHPGVTVTFVEGRQSELLDALNSGRIEIAIMFDGLLPTNLATATLARPRPHILLHKAHRLAGAREVHLRQLEHEPLVFLDAEPSQTFIANTFRAAGARPDIRYRPRSLSHLRALISHGLGYGLIVQGLRHEERFDDGIVAVPLADAPVSEPIVLAQLDSARLTLRARTFWEYCLESRGASRDAPRPVTDATRPPPRSTAP